MRTSALPPLTPGMFPCALRAASLQPLTRHRLQHVIANQCAHWCGNPFSPQGNLATWQYFGRIRTHAPRLSLRTSAHTGVAIRFPAGEPSKLAAAWANSEKLRICLRCCFPFCITARRTDCHVAALLAMTRGEALAPADTCPSSACHCEPVRTLVRQSASPQRNFANWQFLGQIRKSCVFAQSIAFRFALPQELRIATSLRSSQ